MGRLDELNLSLSLSKKDYAERLQAAQGRLTALRLALGGNLTGYITEKDWRNREKRPLYEEALEDMLARTEHPQAPWHLVEGDAKRHARVKVIETVNGRSSAGCASAGFRCPSLRRASGPARARP